MAKGLKTGGRNKGTPNKITSKLKDRINDFLNDNWEQVETDFQALEPERKMMFYEKLLQYVLPKGQIIETPDLKNDVNSISIVFRDFAKERESSTK